MYHKTAYKQSARKFQSKRYLCFWLCNGKKQVNVVTSLFKWVLAFQIVVHQNKWHSLNPETKQKRYACLCKKKLNLKKMIFFTYSEPTLTFSQAKIKNECWHRILRHKWPIQKNVSHDTRAIFWLSDLIWHDLDLDLYLV